MTVQPKPSTPPMSRFHEVLLLVGQLNYTWTNTESLLIHLIAGMARVDKETAIVIFLTLNTTRARIDLVERLAKMAGTPTARKSDVLGVLARMNRQAKLRNKYNHCIYSFDETGTSAHTQLMRIFDSADRIKYGKLEALDDDEMGRIAASIKELASINRRMWEVIRAHGFPE